MNSPDETPSWLVFAIIGGFLVVFPLMWCFVLWLLSMTGGWSRLAKHYAAGDKPVTGDAHQGVSGMVGVASYRHILTLHFNREGFFVEPMAIFRVAHPRLFIPWREVTARTPTMVLWWQCERLTIGLPKVGSITLPADLLKDRPR